MSPGAASLLPGAPADPGLPAQPVRDQPGPARSGDPGRSDPADPAAGTPAPNLVRRTICVRRTMISATTPVIAARVRRPARLLAALPVAALLAGTALAVPAQAV